jgi:hypothetical protein
LLQPESGPKIRAQSLAKTALYILSNHLDVGVEMRKKTVAIIVETALSGLPQPTRRAAISRDSRRPSLMLDGAEATAGALANEQKRNFENILKTVRAACHCEADEENNPQFSATNNTERV